MLKRILIFVTLLVLASSATSNDVAQKMYSEVNYEYPVKESVQASKLVASWGKFKADDIALSDIAAKHKTAIKLLDEVKFDL